MRYLGGKAKIAEVLSRVIRGQVGEATPIWEPFCGGLNMSAKLLPVICSDVSLPLVALVSAVYRGWLPPREVDEELYAFARTLPAENPLHGFCAFGCSFGGKEWGGFARDGRGCNYAAQSAAALIRDVAALARAGTEIWRCSFFDVEPHESTIAIYCDPPYRGRTGYTAAFDHALFDRRCADWARLGVPVLVSEYSMPEHVAEVVWETTKSAGVRGAEMIHVERLYRVRGT